MDINNTCSDILVHTVHHLYIIHYFNSLLLLILYPCSFFTHSFTLAFSLSSDSIIIIIIHHFRRQQKDHHTQSTFFYSSSSSFGSLILCTFSFMNETELISFFSFIWPINDRRHAEKNVIGTARNNNNNNIQVSEKNDIT